MNPDDLPPSSIPSEPPGKRLPPPLIPPAPPPEPEPLHLPKRFWPAVDYFLHHPESVSAAIRKDEELPTLIRFFATSCVILGALYGVVMGLLSLLQGEAVPLWEKSVMPVVCGVKIPTLYLLTLAIIFPPIYVMNAFAGAKLGFRKVAAIMLFGTTVTLVLLASFASVALFFSLTSGSGSFVKLLHTVFFFIAGWAGWAQMLRCLNRATSVGLRVGPSTPAWLTVFWLGLYAFVGLELAWVMRPFFGTPGQPFELFRPRGGNIIEAIGGWSEDWLTRKD